MADPTKTVNTSSYVLSHHDVTAVIYTLVNFLITNIIIYTKKLLNSDWLRKECSSSVTRVQITNGF